jgi:protocatechuate 3,4-dioxygenase beta subunit
MTDNNNVTRRTALAGLASSTFGASQAFADATPEQLGKILPSKVCMITPQAVEGPYYFDPKLVRGDIREGRAGVPLKLLLQVVEASTCRPLEGARLDIWHADAIGIYSGYENQSDDRKLSTVGKSFLRGTQFTDKAGQASFMSIYPGWYKGRTAHIHFKAFLDNKEVLVGQMYFPDAMNEYIYTKVAPYNQRSSARDTFNRTDFIAKQDGDASFCSVREEASQYLASLVIGAERNGNPRAMGLRPGGSPAEGRGPRTPRPRDGSPLVPD